MIRILSRPVVSLKHVDCIRRMAPRCHSTVAVESYVNDDNNSWQHEEDDEKTKREIHRLQRLRNVGILAHVDAGKTTVTERMLALAGVVRRAGSVDDGNTTTDFLPAERERGITIQSAAISFPWGWHNHSHFHYPIHEIDNMNSSDVDIHLIDTPGHVDFSVEVNRSVAVLDGAILVVDAVAGVQAQTETVWRAMTRTTSFANNNEKDHAHEPLPCLAFINKMDQEGHHFANALESLRNKLPGANPIALQLPLFRESSSSLVAIGLCKKEEMPQGKFVGVVDLVHMRAVVYPEPPGSTVEANVPTVIPLVDADSQQPLDPTCSMTQAALKGRQDVIAALANVDEIMEECYLMEEQPSNADLNAALRRATLARDVLPVLAGAALKGRGIEPLLDCVADLLPSPLDRLPPTLTQSGNQYQPTDNNNNNAPVLGHALHSQLLALAFKVVHEKNRGRVVYCRVYSGRIKDKDQLLVSSPGGESPSRVQRVGGMLELTAGGRLNQVSEICQSGEVCALVGLRDVTTGDTIRLYNKNKDQQQQPPVWLAGVAAPKPVLTVKLEAETSSEQKRLSEALEIMVMEDPSLIVEESESTTLISGLGELHIEVTLDRLRRDYGISNIRTGPPAVSYREIMTKPIMTSYEYDQTIGNNRMQASIELNLEPTNCANDHSNSSCHVLSEPKITIAPLVREYLNLDPNKGEEQLIQESEIAMALVAGCSGSLKRGPIGSNAMSNLSCEITRVEVDDLASLQPGALRATASHAIQDALKKQSDAITLTEPTMSIEITVHNDYVGTVLNDLVSNRRGTVGSVILDEENKSSHQKALVQGEVPLLEILGYANELRSLTGGEGVFTAEYKGHAPSHHTDTR